MNNIYYKSIFYMYFAFYILLYFDADTMPVGSVKTGIVKSEPSEKALITGSNGQYVNNYKIM